MNITKEELDRMELEADLRAREILGQFMKEYNASSKPQPPVLIEAQENATSEE